MNIRSFRGIVSLVLLSSLISAEPLWGVTVDFNSPTDLNQFIVFGQSVEPTTGGVTGDAIRIQNPNIYAASRLIYNQPLSYIDSGVEIITSMMFHYDQLVVLSNGGGIGSALASLQLLSDPNFAATTRWIDVGFFASQQTLTDPITFNISVSRLLGGSGNGNSVAISPPVDEHWYRLSARFTSSDAFPNGVQVALDDFGLDGMTFLGNVGQITTAYGDGALLRDSTVWAGFGMQLPRGHGNDRSDNFTITVVPEPSATTLAVIGVCIVWRKRRRA